MMELTITSMTPVDRLYAYNQGSQLEGQTGCIGHLRGDFGAGKEFYTSWFDHRREYKTDEFKTELDEVVNTLREKNGLLCTRDSMTRFCYQNPEAEFEGNYCAEYGFKVQTPQHTYMLRCNPNYGDYNFYLYAYVSRFLEHHMEKAKQGIRFITPGYKELFRIPDGDHIRIFTGGGETRDRTCRWPGCRRSATRSEADHTVAWQDGGTTCAANLAILCKGHHTLTQQGGDGRGKHEDHHRKGHDPRHFAPAIQVTHHGEGDGPRTGSA